MYNNNSNNNFGNNNNGSFKSNNNSGGNFDASFDVTESIAVLSSWTSNFNGSVNSKEINKVSWNGRGPVVDIRNWFVDQNGEKKPGKGVTLNDSEAHTLCQNLLALGYGGPAN